MAGKKAFCPSCKAVIAIPEQDVPVAVFEPQPVEMAAAPSAEPTASLDITKPPGMVSRAEDERAALNIVRVIYVFVRSDGRRLATCPHLWLVFFLFFLPWLNISCNGRTVATQTGMQTCFGSATIDPKIDKWGRAHGNFGGGPNVVRARLDEPVPWSLLSLIYIVFVFLGGFVALACIVCVFLRLRAVATGAHLFALGLGGAAFLALAAQMLIGFPVERHAKAQAEKIRTEQRQRNDLPKGNDPVEVLFDLDTTYSGWLWLSLLLTFVSAPVFLLEFAVLFVDAIKKHMRQRADSG